LRFVTIIHPFLRDIFAHFLNRCGEHFKEFFMRFFTDYLSIFSKTRWEVFLLKTIFVKDVEYNLFIDNQKTIQIPFSVFNMKKYNLPAK
jgi:hypothetical protein